MERGIASTTTDETGDTPTYDTLRRLQVPLPGYSHGTGHLPPSFYHNLIENEPNDIIHLPNRDHTSILPNRDTTTSTREHTYASIPTTSRKKVMQKTTEHPITSVNSSKLQTHHIIFITWARPSRYRKRHTQQPPTPTISVTNKDNPHQAPIPT